MNIYNLSKDLKHDGVYVIEFHNSHTLDVIQKAGPGVYNLGYIKDNSLFYEYPEYEISDLTHDSKIGFFVPSEVEIIDYYSDSLKFEKDFNKVLS